MNQHKREAQARTSNGMKRLILLYTCFIRKDAFIRKFEMNKSSLNQNIPSQPYQILGSLAVQELFHTLLLSLSQAVPKKCCLTEVEQPAPKSPASCINWRIWKAMMFNDMSTPWPDHCLFLVLLLYREWILTGWSRKCFCQIWEVKLMSSCTPNWFHTYVYSIYPVSPAF